MKNKLKVVVILAKVLVVEKYKNTNLKVQKKLKFVEAT